MKDLTVYGRCHRLQRNDCSRSVNRMYRHDACFLAPLCHTGRDLREKSHYGVYDSGGEQDVLHIFTSKPLIGNIPEIPSVSPQKEFLFVCCKKEKITPKIKHIPENGGK